MRIIYFDIDCLRPDHLGCYGYGRPTSPNLDRIAAQGVRLDRYYCPSSPCLPSRTVWASGRYGIRNGVLSNHGAGARFRIANNAYVGPKAENEMLMRQLRRHGVETISFSNFADRHNALWFMIGWSEFHTPNLKGGDETAEEVNARLLPWLRQNARRENYFLHVNYWDAHRCYKMEGSWADRFRDSAVAQDWPDEAAIARHQAIGGPFTAQAQFPDCRSPFPLMPGGVRNRREFEHMVTGYDAAIAYVDHHVGQVLEEMDRQGVLEDAVVIVSSDHGDAFGEHGIYSDHVNADDCIHHIPLIVKWPGQTTPGSRHAGMVSTVDFAPTLCELLGVPPAEDWDGMSFADNLRGGAGLDRECLVWDCALYTVQRAVRTRTHLMIRTYDDYGYPHAPIELYNLQADPYQTTNIAESEPEVVEQCMRRMEAWVVEQRRRSRWAPDPLEEVLRERGVRE